MDEQDKVRNFNRRVEELIKYVKEYIRIEREYIKIINKLIKKFNKNKYNPVKRAIYAELLAKKYENWLEEFNEIEVPPFLNDANSYQFKQLYNEKYLYSLFCNPFSRFGNPLSFFANMSDELDYDIDDNAEKIENEIQLAQIKSINEIERVKKSLNKKAKELGLSKPFLDTD